MVNRQENGRVFAFLCCALWDWEMKVSVEDLFSTDFHTNLDTTGRKYTTFTHSANQSASLRLKQSVICVSFTIEARNDAECNAETDGRRSLSLSSLFFDPHAGRDITEQVANTQST
jgi:hypothetical protein